MGDQATVTVSDATQEPGLDAAGLEALRKEADAAYCKYVDKLRTRECLGEASKLQDGTFGLAELNAHREARELLGIHRGIHKALDAIRAYEAHRSGAGEPVGVVENYGGIRWFNPPIPIGTKLYASPAKAGELTKQQAMEQARHLVANYGSDPEGMLVGAIAAALLSHAPASMNGTQGEAEGWMPIETAPKDGTNVLGAHDQAAIVVSWCSERTVDGAPGWANGETDLDGYFYTYPVTHWMPLPPLPAQGESR